MTISKVNPASFKGYSMASIHIRSKDCIVFIASKDSEDGVSDTMENIDYKTVFYYPNAPTEEQWLDRVAAETHTFIGGASTHPTDQSIFITHDGVVLRTGNGDWEWEKPLPTIREKQLYTFPISIKGIENGHLYVTAHRMQVLRRDGANKWSYLSEGFPKSEEKEGVHFKDIDGFSDSDLYVCGKKGNVWNWNGKQWKIVDVPSNALLNNILCAGDGNVYIFDNKGYFYIGREDRWEIIKQEKFDWTWLDSMVWFKDRVYVSTQSQLFQIKNSIFEKCPLDSHKNSPPQWAKMHARDGILVAGSSRGAVLYDGKNLITIF